MENPIKIDDFGGPPVFLEAPKYWPNQFSPRLPLYCAELCC